MRQIQAGGLTGSAWTIAAACMPFSWSVVPTKAMSIAVHPEAVLDRHTCIESYAKGTT